MELTKRERKLLEAADRYIPNHNRIMPICIIVAIIAISVAGLIALVDKNFWSFLAAFFFALYLGQFYERYHFGLDVFTLIQKLRREKT